MSWVVGCNEDIRALWATTSQYCALKKSAVVPIQLEEVQIAIQSIGGWQYVEKDMAFIKKDDNDNLCALWYDNGELWASNPSQWALEQMIALSLQLQARVRSDEFETYETVDKCYNHPDDVKLKKKQKKQTKPCW